MVTELYPFKESVRIFWSYRLSKLEVRNPFEKLGGLQRMSQNKDSSGYFGISTVHTYFDFTGDALCELEKLATRIHICSPSRGYCLPIVPTHRLCGVQFESKKLEDVYYEHRRKDCSISFISDYNL